jgi:2',3'-cyclic-nucleotide 2'-phosphodiesterase
LRGVREPFAAPHRLPRVTAHHTLPPVNLLFIGDIVGEPGRRAIRSLLPGLRERHAIDFVVANGENSAGGNGITAAIAEEIFNLGIDVITTGDHVWDQKDTASLLAREPRVLRPANYPPGVPGRGSIVHTRPGQPPVAVLNLQGRTFMPNLENPFVLADAEVNRLRTETPIVFVDIHAEATSEKIALGRFLDGRASAVIGTHTHVQTADEWVLPGGTAFLSDAGFTGPHDSVLGRTVEPIVRRFLTGMPSRFEVASERVLLQGALIEIDATTGRARTISRVSESLR